MKTLPALPELTEILILNKHHGSGEWIHLGIHKGVNSYIYHFIPVLVDSKPPSQNLAVVFEFIPSVELYDRSVTWKSIEFFEEILRPTKHLL